MSLIVCKTDLFKPLPNVLGHGVNAKGVMGKGVAAIVRQRFPTAYGSYRDLCTRGLLRPGDVHYWTAGNYHVFNLCTQLKPGRGADLEAIDESVNEMLRMAALLELAAVHVPKIGCGIGGLRYERVLPVLERIVRHHSTDLILHDYEPTRGVP